jgi:hypothetical protein
MIEDDQLAFEMAYIARSTFDVEDVPPELIGHYVAIHEILAIPRDGGLRIPVSELARRGSDLEAIEVSLRGSGSALEKKFLIVSYLLESHGATLPTYIDVGLRQDRWKFIAMTMLEGARFIVKKSKGWILRRIHGL